MNELSITISGNPIAKKRCTKCKQVKEVSLFSKNRRNKDGLHSECKPCSSENNRTYRMNNVDKRRTAQRNKYLRDIVSSRQKSRENYYRNKQSVLDRQRETRKSNSALLYNSIGGAFCRLCGYDKHIGSLQLHHLNSNQKDNHKDVLSNWIKIPNKERFISKLRDVDFTILCANCHISLHMGEIDDYGLKPLEVKI
jgi:hypothetical protein